MTSWFDINCSQASLVSIDKNDISSLLKLVGAFIGYQQWFRFENYNDLCGVNVHIDNLSTVHSYLFDKDYKTTYGPNNPIKEFLMFSSKDLIEAFSELKTSTISVDPRTHFIVIVYLKCKNHIVIRKIPKNYITMFGSKSQRNLVEKSQNIFQNKDEMQIF